MESTLRLFKALPVDTYTGSTAVDKESMETTLKSGFVFSPEVIANYPDTKHITTLVNKLYGKNSEELNQSFHKSWKKVKEAPIQQLILEQIVHYFTTYGAETLGFYDEESVYIPSERLEVPELESGFRVVIIRGLTKAELKELLINLLSSGIALHEQTKKDILDVANFVGFEEKDINLVANREVKVALYDLFNIVPSDPFEFLRYIVYQSTEQTLLIKNKALLGAIKNKDNTRIVKYFNTYEKDVGLAKLSTIFYRYKPIFLAFRTNTQLKKKINQVRRLAKANHVPLKPILLNDLTSHLRNGKLPAELNDELDKVNVFRKIRLAYALKFRLSDSESILYRVRNGKSYAKEFSFKNKELAQEAYDIIIESIRKDIAKNVEGKSIYLPAGIMYGLPATEKQFTGNFPSGTSVEVDKNMVFGVHWVNHQDYRVDLDLSIMSATTKFGWDANYRGNGILFSGDNTTAPAPKGASELFYIGKDSSVQDDVYLMMCNYFNYNEQRPVPFKILIGQEDIKSLGAKHTINPNNIVAQSNSVMDVHQKNLGIVVVSGDKCRYIFSESNLGGGISARNAKYTEQAREYLLNYYTNTISLNKVLESIDNVEFVDSPEEADIDLSTEAINKTTILDLLKA